MPTMNEMQEKVEDRVLALMVEFEENIDKNNCKYEMNVPEEIRFDKNGTVAGTSCFNYHRGSGHLNFNPELMEKNWDTFDTTIIHEVAHYCVSIYWGMVVDRRGRRQSHGKAWKSMMRFFGVSDVQRCHTYDTSKIKRARKVKRFGYDCPCGEPHNVSTRMHNQITKGRTRICSLCNGDIEFNGKVQMIGG